MGPFWCCRCPCPSSQATGISDDGTVVGFVQPSPTAPTASGFILEDGHLTVLNYPGATVTEALGVNDEGEVVGFYNDAKGNAHGFTYWRGRCQAVDAPDATQTTLNGVNDAGRLVGFVQAADGTTAGGGSSPPEGRRRRRRSTGAAREPRGAAGVFPDACGPHPPYTRR
jgi:probable HAF family extracellular repeat protein